MTLYDVALIREGYALRFESRSGDHTLDVDVVDISSVEYFNSIRTVILATKQARSWNLPLAPTMFSYLKSLLGTHHPEQ